MFEHRSQPLLSQRRFIVRAIRYVFFAGGIIGLSLLIGMAGYHFLRELAGVGGQIKQGRADFDDVGIHAADAGGENDVEGVAVLFGHGADEFDDFVDQFGDEEGGGVDFDFAGLDFGHFEDGIDEFEEVLAGGLDQDVALGDAP